MTTKKSIADQVEALGSVADSSALFKAQKQANTTVAKGFNQYQVVLCAAILHVAKHRDTTVITKLIESMPEGMRVKSAKDFMQTFGTIDFGDEGAVVLNDSKRLALGEALEAKWWTFGGKEEKTFNLDEAIKALLAKAKKRQEKPKEGDQINPEAIALLAGVVNRIGSGVAMAA
jgi:hypothetical protein